MAIDTTKKVTAISVDGVQLELAGAKEKIDNVKITGLNGTQGVLGYIEYDKGLVIVYGTKIAIYDFATQQQTEVISDFSIDSNVKLKMLVLENKVCLVYSAYLSGYPYSRVGDFLYINLKTKQAQKLYKNPPEGSSFNNAIIWKDGVYSVMLRGSGGVLGSGHFRLNVDTGEFSKISSVNAVGADPNIVVLKMRDRYFYRTSYYDALTDDFYTIDTTEGTGAYTPYVAKVINNNMALINDAQTNYTGTNGYYLYDTNKSYPIATSTRRFEYCVPFDNGNCVFVKNSTDTYGLWFLDVTTNTVTQIVTTGYFYISNGNYPWCYNDGTKAVFTDTTGQLVEVLQDGTHYVSAITVSTSYGGRQGFLLHNGKLYITRSVSNFGVWEYDFTTHSAVNIYENNAGFNILFFVDNKIYAGGDSAKGLMLIDTSTHTATSVYSTGSFTEVAKVDTEKWLFIARDKKLLYDALEDTYTSISTSTTATGSNSVDIGNYTVLFGKKETFDINRTTEKNSVKKTPTNYGVAYYNKQTGDFIKSEMLSYDVIKYNADKVLIVATTSIGKIVDNGSLQVLKNIKEVLGYSNTSYNEFELKNTTSTEAKIGTKVTATSSTSPSSYTKNNAELTFDYGTETLQLDNIEIVL